MSKSPRYVIGLTGLPSSGKGEVTAAILRLAAVRGLRGEHLSFSDCIKEEARRRGIRDQDFHRELLSQIGTEMRETEGPGVLAKRIARTIETWPEPRPDVFVVEALRHTGEAAALREAFAERFTLAAVESKPEEIARRLIARRRPDESREALKSEKHAVELLERELHGQVSQNAPNVASCAALADAHLPNHGTLDELRETVRRFFESVVAPD